MSGFFQRIIDGSIRKIGPRAIEAAPVVPDLVEVSEETVADFAAPEPEAVPALPEAVSSPAYRVAEPIATAQPSPFAAAEKPEFLKTGDAGQSIRHESPERVARSPMPEPPATAQPGQTTPKENIGLLRSAEIQVVTPGRQMPDSRFPLSSLGKWLSGSAPSVSQHDDGLRGVSPPAPIETVVEKVEKNETEIRERTYDAKRKRDSAQPQETSRKRDSAQPQETSRKRSSAQPQDAKSKQGTAVVREAAMQPASLDPISVPAVRNASRSAPSQDIVIHNLEVRVAGPAEPASEPQREVRQQTPPSGAWAAPARYYLRKV